MSAPGLKHLIIVFLCLICSSALVETLLVDKRVFWDLLNVALKPPFTMPELLSSKT